MQAAVRSPRSREQPGCHEPLDHGAPFQVGPSIDLEVEPKKRGRWEAKTRTVGKDGGGRGPGRLVSDDEQSIGVAAALANHPHDVFHVSVELLARVHLGRPMSGVPSQFNGLLGA